MQQLYLIQPCGKHGPGADNAPLAVGIRLQRFSFARAGPCGCQEGGAGGHGVCPECPLEYAGLSCWMEVSELLAWGMSLFAICSESFANLNEETGNYEIPTMYGPNEHFVPPREPAMPLMRLLESWSENRLDLMITRLSVAQRFFKSILEHVPEDSLSSLIQQICIWNVLFSLELGGYLLHVFKT